MGHVNILSDTDKNGDALDTETTRCLLRETAKDIPAVSPAIFARIERNLDKVESRAADQGISRNSPLQVLLNRWRNYAGRPQLPWGVVVVQGIAICLFLFFQPINIPNAYQTLSLENNGVQSQSHEWVKFNVIFDDNARMSEIGNLFSGLNAVIAIGSGQRGIYTIKIMPSTSSETEDLVLTLKKSPLIRFMEKAY